MIKKTNAICVFNIFIDNATYGSSYVTNETNGGLYTPKLKDDL
jgi:hypothetical protein